MPKAPLFNREGERVGDIELSEGVFGAEVKEALLHSAVKMQLASERRGTVATKTIGFVSGGGRKPWRQKGTGRARQGSTRSPLWVGGATVFGPQPRDYSYKLPKSARPVALKSALSSKAASDEIAVIEALEMKEPKTKAFHGLLNKVAQAPKVLVVMDSPDEKVEKSARNIPGVKTVSYNGLNVYDVLYHEKVLFTKDALRRVEEVLG